MAPRGEKSCLVRGGAEVYVTTNAISGQTEGHNTTKCWCSSLKVLRKRVLRERVQHFAATAHAFKFAAQKVARLVILLCFLLLPSEQGPLALRFM